MTETDILIPEETPKQEENDEHIRYAVYGILSRGLSEDEDKTNRWNLVYEEDRVAIPGFGMYSLGGYPFVKRSQDPESQVVADICYFNNDRSRINVDMMERGAGYHIEEIEHDGKTLRIYLYPENYEVEREERVEDGDWVEFQTRARERRQAENNSSDNSNN